MQILAGVGAGAGLESVEYLVIGGGAAWGTIQAGYFAGGGGAGQVNTGTVSVVPGTNYTITVGTGGAVLSASGGTTTFRTVTSVGGSAGTNSNGGTSGNGFAGGTRAGAAYGSGAGGGSTAIGGNAIDNTGAVGGTGTTSSITGTSVVYARGGDTLDKWTIGSHNAGSGGGVNSGGGNENGKDGVVIFRYSDQFPAAASTTGSPTITVTGGFRIYQFAVSGSVTF
jgi:hypothetical protein